MTEDKKAAWTMPEWMEPYRKLIGNTGGNTPEDLIGRLDTDKHLSQSNSIVFCMAISVEQQVHLLERLRREGLLK